MSSAWYAGVGIGVEPQSWYPLASLFIMRAWSAVGRVVGRAAGTVATAGAVLLAPLLTGPAAAGDSGGDLANGVKRVSRTHNAANGGGTESENSSGSGQHS